MTLAEPIFLLALALPVLLAAAYLVRRRGRRRHAIRLPATAALAAASRRGPRWRAWVTPLLLAASAVALVISLARPHAIVDVAVDQAAVMLVTDASGSMRATDVEPTRMRAAQDAAERFLDRVPDSLLVGFLAYSTAPSMSVEPTLDRDPVRSAIQSLQADGGTATGDALEATLDRLEQRTGDDGRVNPAAIVLLSDGKNTVGSDPVEAAERAGRLDIPIYTVALGTDDGVVTDPLGGLVPVPPDPETLREIARESGGSAFRAADAAELDAVYERLGSRIGTRPQPREISSRFAVAGLLLLLTALAFGLRVRGRTP